MKSRMFALTSLCAATLFASAGWAQEDDLRLGVCRTDVASLCKDVKPGEGRVALCLQEHEADLSGPCRDHMAETQAQLEQRRKEFREACGADVDQFCKGVQFGEGRVNECLKSNQDQLSQVCKDYVAAEQGEYAQKQEFIKSFTEACGSEVKQFCKDVKPGGGRVAMCLTKNDAQLSEGCKAALSSLQ